MRILHTADWHLGKKLDRFSRLAEQEQVMEEIIAVADEQEADLVLVAGDLFDTFNPTHEAIELFYRTLKRLARDGARPVIAISGNHDAPGLIDAPDPLARECGIILIGHPAAEVHPCNTQHFNVIRSVPGMIELQLHRYDYPIRIIHTAYANEVRLKQYLGEDKAEGLNHLLYNHWKEVAEAFCDDRGVNVLAAHLYINQRGAPLLEEPDGEKPIKVGNADLVYADAVPPQIQYAALGHLHAFRDIGPQDQPVVYASSPLCYSFSEAGQDKFVVMVDAVPGRPVSYEKIRLQKGKPLLRKRCESVGDAVAWLNEHKDAYVELTLETETFLRADEQMLLYQSHPAIVYLIPYVKSQEEGTVSHNRIDLSQDTVSLFKAYFKSRHGGQEPNEELLDLFNEISRT